MQVGFLLLAALILAGAVAVLGELVNRQMSQSITAGVADTAAASMDLMLGDELAEIGPARPLSPEASAQLDGVFSAASDARLNKLIQLRLHNVDGSLLYQSLGGLLDAAPPGEALANALLGTTTSQVLDLPLAPIGPIATADVPTLKVVTPVHDRGTGAVIAIAELYFGARGLVDLENQSTWRVWLAVAAVGLLAIGALYVLVNRAGRTITTQRQSLAENLLASQRLANENGQLRQAANVANERLLAQVGSDLHDGPLQMLTLLILKLSRAGRAPADGEVGIAQQVMEELRSISAGLVLPELSTLTLGDTVALAIARHEQIFGTAIVADLPSLSVATSLDLKLCLYRIVQESLLNAQRHGVPGTVRIAITRHPHSLQLDVSNEIAWAVLSVVIPGRPRRLRLGMDGMRARLQSVGGRLRFETRDGVAYLAVSVPLESMIHSD